MSACQVALQTVVAPKAQPASLPRLQHSKQHSKQHSRSLPSLRSTGDCLERPRDKAASLRKSRSLEPPLGQSSVIHPDRRARLTRVCRYNVAGAMLMICSAASMCSFASSLLLAQSMLGAALGLTVPLACMLAANRLPQQHRVVRHALWVAFNVSSGLVLACLGAVGWTMLAIALVGTVATVVLLHGLQWRKSGHANSEKERPELQHVSTLSTAMFVGRPSSGVLWLLSVLLTALSGGGAIQQLESNLLQVARHAELDAHFDVLGSSLVLLADCFACFNAGARLLGMLPGQLTNFMQRLMARPFK